MKTWKQIAAFIAKHDLPYFVGAGGILVDAYTGKVAAFSIKSANALLK